jgi:hypothetical protein
VWGPPLALHYPLDLIGATIQAASRHTLLEYKRITYAIVDIYPFLGLLG